MTITLKVIILGLLFLFYSFLIFSNIFPLKEGLTDETTTKDPVAEAKAQANQAKAQADVADAEAKLAVAKAEAAAANEQTIPVVDTATTTVSASAPINIPMVSVPQNTTSKKSIPVVSSTTTNTKS
jgi:hypothetical protein